MDKNNFALRLNRLFDEKRKSDGKRYSQTEVLEHTRGTLTRVYLWKLRNAYALNPSLQVIRSLATFFGVDPGYFFENDAAHSETAGDSLAREIAIKAYALHPQEQQMVLFMIEAIQNSHRLNDAKEAPPPAVRRESKKSGVERQGG